MEKKQRTGYDKEDTDANCRDMDVMSFVSSLLSQGQSIPIAELPTPARTYHLLREDDDWSFLADPAEATGFLGSHQIHSSAIRPE